MVLVGCAALTASCKQAPVAQMEAEYAVLKVSPSDKVLSTTYSATIRGRQDIDIYPQVSGFLTRLCVEEGQAVRKGQVLFIIDQVPYKAALETAVANVESAKAGPKWCGLQSRKRSHSPGIRGNRRGHCTSVSR